MTFSSHRLHIAAVGLFGLAMGPLGCADVDAAGLEVDDGETGELLAGAHCVAPAHVMEAAGLFTGDLGCDHEESTPDDLPICLPLEGTYISTMCGSDGVDRFALDVPYVPAIVELALDASAGDAGWQLIGEVDGPHNLGFDDRLSSGGKVIWLGEFERLWIELSANASVPDAQYEFSVDVHPHPLATQVCREQPLGSVCEFRALGHDFSGRCVDDGRFRSCVR